MASLYFVLADFIFVGEIFIFIGEIISIRSRGQLFPSSCSPSLRDIKLYKDSLKFQNASFEMTFDLNFHPFSKLCFYWYNVMLLLVQLPLSQSK